jgi:hypothetical protein
MHQTFKRPVIVVLLLLLVAFAGRTAALAQGAGQIDAIKKLYQKTNDEIARSEQEPDTSTIFLTELRLNKNRSPYPAVGIYKTVVKFYYTFGNRERDPYPNRLLKIVISTDRSDRKEYSEFLFDEAEQLVFYFEKKDDLERRVYFSSEEPIRFQQGERPLSLKNKLQTVVVTTILKERANLGEIFRRSLRF